MARVLGCQSPLSCAVGGVAAAQFEARRKKLALDLPRTQPTPRRLRIAASLTPRRFLKHPSDHADVEVATSPAALQTYAGTSSKLMLLPSAAAALASVVSVRLVSSASSSRFSAARLVFIFFANAVFVMLRVFISCSICHAITRFTAVAVAPSSKASSARKSSKLPCPTRKLK